MHDLRSWQLIEGFADVLVAEDPHLVSERVFDLTASSLGGWRMALFARHQDEVRLLASRALDGEVVELVGYVWSEHRKTLEAGRPWPVNVDAGSKLPVVRAVLSHAQAVIVAPVMGRGRLVGLCYVDSNAHVFTAEHVETALRLARLAGVLCRDCSAQRESEEARSSYLLRTPLKDIARRQLLEALSAHEWNIARVARLLGVTRRTIYMRLARYKIERLKVPKGPRRVAAVAVSSKSKP